MLVIAGNWWTFVLRGVVAILFGLLAFFWPGLSLLTLVFMFGFYALADGAFSIAAAFRQAGEPEHRPWWALAIRGVISIVAGLLAIFQPGLTAIALLYLIAGWAVATGIMEIAAAIRLRRQIEGEWLLALSGALSILLGVVLALFPGAGALAVVLWIGAYAIVLGVLLVMLGLKLRKWMRPGEEPGHGFRVAPGH